MQRLQNHRPLFIDGRGALVDAGYIYVGAAGTDPEIEANQLDLFIDQALTTPIAQPLRTSGGMIVDGANPVFVYLAEADYSMTIRDANGQVVDYIPTSAVTTVAYQPLSDDLTAIDGQANTAYGLALLLLANQDALQAAVGLPDALPLAGGTVTGDITRQGAGVHPFFYDSTITGGRIFITAAGAADPTSEPGDIWLQTS